MSKRMTSRMQIDINMNEIEDAINVEEIVKEWQMSVLFIN
jgi:hypothetical protein